MGQNSEQALSVQSAVQELTGLAEQLRQLAGKFQVETGEGFHGQVNLA